jgi:DNA-binding transcriptional LysR family regulator
VLTAANGRRVRVSMQVRATADNQHAVRELTLAGAGLSFQALPEVEGELRAGRLVRVMPAWAAPRLSVDALMPQRAEQPAKVRLALEALKAWLAPSAPTAHGRRGR